MPLGQFSSVRCPERNNKSLLESNANTFSQGLKWTEWTARGKCCVHLRLENQERAETPEVSLSQREETWAGSVPLWNLPHWHLPEPKPHSGSLESRVEWQHFLHPFRVPQYGKHLDLLKKKSQVIHWLRCDFFLSLFFFWWYFG